MGVLNHFAINYFDVVQAAWVNLSYLFWDRICCRMWILKNMIHDMNWKVIWRSNTIEIKLRYRCHHRVQVSIGKNEVNRSWGIVFALCSKRPSRSPSWRIEKTKCCECIWIASDCFIAKLTNLQSHNPAWLLLDNKHHSYRPWIPLARVSSSSLQPSRVKSPQIKCLILT